MRAAPPGAPQPGGAAGSVLPGRGRDLATAEPTKIPGEQEQDDHRCHDVPDAPVLKVHEALRALTKRLRKPYPSGQPTSMPLMPRPRSSASPFVARPTSKSRTVPFDRRTDSAPLRPCSSGMLAAALPSLPPGTYLSASQQQVGGTRRWLGARAGVSSDPGRGPSPARIVSWCAGCHVAPDHSAGCWH